MRINTTLRLLLALGLTFFANSLFAQIFQLLTQQELYKQLHVSHVKISGGFEHILNQNGQTVFAFYQGKESFISIFNAYNQHGQDSQSLMMTTYKNGLLIIDDNRMLYNVHQQQTKSITYHTEIPGNQGDTLVTTYSYANDTTTRYYIMEVKDERNNAMTNSQVILNTHSKDVDTIISYVSYQSVNPNARNDSFAVQLYIDNHLAYLQSGNPALIFYFKEINTRLNNGLLQISSQYYRNHMSPSTIDSVFYNSANQPIKSIRYDTVFSSGCMIIRKANLTTKWYHYNTRGQLDKMKETCYNGRYKTTSIHRYKFHKNGLLKYERYNEFRYFWLMRIFFKREKHTIRYQYQYDMFP
jgi:hypothetical protein